MDRRIAGAVVGGLGDVGGVFPVAEQLLGQGVRRLGLDVAREDQLGRDGRQRVRWNAATSARWICGMVVGVPEPALPYGASPNTTRPTANEAMELGSVSDTRRLSSV